MQLRLAAPVAVLALAGAAVPALATPRAASSVTFAAAHVVRGDLGAATGTPSAWAARALRAQAGRLGVDASQYKLETVRTSLIGTHVRGRQFRGGLPVEGTEALVTAIAGRVVQVDAFGTALPGAPAAAPVGQVVARAAALRRLAVTALLVPTTTTRVLVPAGPHLVDTYQVSVVAKHPATVARVDVDAVTGRVLRVVDSAKHDEVPAKVFDPNPVVTSRNTNLRSTAETYTGVDVPVDSAQLTAQLRTVALKGLNHSDYLQGKLIGPYVNLIAPVGYLNPLGGPLSYSRSDPRFVGLMAYAHLDRYQRWLQSLGFNNVNAESQDVLPTLLEGYDNSMYVPARDIVVFGGGGVPDAEDAEVILHEYGHAMQDDQVPGYGRTDDGGAMGEGFGDFNAANYYALTSKGFGDLCVAEWDSTTYGSGEAPCLRRMDSRKHYPRDLDSKREVHADGELWSAFLWRLRSHLGRDTRSRSINGARLVVSSHELQTAGATFASSVASLRTAGNALHHKDWAKWVDVEARKTGFALNP